MPKTYINLFIYAILFFHIGVTIHGFYTFYSSDAVWNIYAALPILYLIFTLTWTGIVFKKRWCAFVYFSLVFYELAMKLFFGKYIFGKVLGEVFFPVDLVFALMILLLYKQLYKEKEAA